MYIANFPLLFIWLWFAIRARDLFFFSAVNPVIETGGLFGESKYNILKRIPGTHLPATVFVKKGTSEKRVLEKMKNAKLEFPVIAKPDVGERGTLVAKIKDETALVRYVRKNKIDFLLQEFVSLPMELAVMHHRMPGKDKGRVTSVCIKETLKITGDGISSIRKLMANYDRAILQLARFEKKYPALLNRTPLAGEVVELEPIGNHCRGTMFLNGNQHIDEELNAAFDKVAFQMEDIYYGRFDLKCESFHALKNGGGFMIMEYNGIGAEPAHIYDPAYPFIKKYRDIYHHWKIIYKIYKLQNKKGNKGMSFWEAWKRFQIYSKYQKSLTAE